MKICSVKKLNQRPCRNKCDNNICEYHRFHPYLSPKKRRLFKVDSYDVVNIEKTNYKKNTYKNINTKKKNTVINFWKVLIFLFLVGVVSVKDYELDVNALYTVSNNVSETLMNSVRETMDGVSNVISGEVSQTMIDGLSNMMNGVSKMMNVVRETIVIMMVNYNQDYNEYYSNIGKLIGEFR